MKTKRLLKSFTTMLVVLTLVVSSFSAAFAANVKSVKITAQASEMKVGSSKQFKAVSSPKAKITWASSDKRVATVSNSGKVSAVAAGEVKITAKAGNKSAVVTVNVVEEAAKAADNTPANKPNTDNKTDAKKDDGKNMIVNAGFEDGQSPWETNWDCSIAVSNKEAASGKNSLEISKRTQCGSCGIQFVNNKLVPGETYKFSVKIKYTNGPASHDFNFSCIHGDNPWTDIEAMGKANVKKGEWATISGTYTFPENANPAVVGLFVETPYMASPDKSNDLFDYYVDDFSFVKQ